MAAPVFLGVISRLPLVTKDNQINLNLASGCYLKQYSCSLTVAIYLVGVLEAGDIQPGKRLRGDTPNVGFVKEGVLNRGALFVLREFSGQLISCVLR